jgi:hypothetical protein
MKVDDAGEQHPAAGRSCRPIDVDRFDPAVVDEDAAGPENPFGREHAVRYDFEGHDELIGEETAGPGSSDDSMTLP